MESELLRRASVFLVEAVAATLSIFALYEILYSKRTVDSFTARLEFCHTVHLDQATMDFSRNAEFLRFVADRTNEFVYLDVDIRGIRTADVTMVCDREDAPIAYLDSLDTVTIDSRGLKDEIDFFLMSLDVNYQDVNNGLLMGQPIGDIEEFRSARIDGIFFVKAVGAEGTLYVDLLVPPFSVELYRTTRCTRSLVEKEGFEWVLVYVKDCLLQT